MNSWYDQHLNFVIELLSQAQKGEILDEVLSTKTEQWNACMNIFVYMKEDQRVQFIETVLRSFSYNRNGVNQAQLALSRKPYDSYLILNLIELTTYRKL